MNTLRIFCGASAGLDAAFGFEGKALSSQRSPKRFAPMN